MELRLKSIVAAVALVLGSAVANAQAPVVPPQPPTISAPGLLSGISNGNGPLLAAVWDTTTGSSLVQWLGLGYNDVSIPAMTIPGTTLNFGTLSGFSTTFAGAIGDSQTNRLQYLVIAADPEFSGITTPYGTNIRVTGSANIPTVFSDPQAGNQVGGAANAVATYVDTVINQTFGVAGDFCNFANPCSIINNSAGQVYFGRAQLGADLGGNLNAAASYAGSVGSSLGFYQISNAADGDLETYPATVATFAGGSWLVNSLGNLTYTVAGGTPVPLPAAVWLLVSGLAGLGVVGRRRAATV